MSKLGSEAALDTNAAIKILNGQLDAGSWLARIRRFYLPVPVLAELTFGALNSHRRAENLKRIQELTDRCRILSADRRSAEIHAEMRLALKRQGTPIPENDLWIAAICHRNKITLATDDHHFGSVPDLLYRQP